MQSHAGYLGSLSIHNDQDFYTKKILIKTSEQNMCNLGVTYRHKGIYHIKGFSSGSSSPQMDQMSTVSFITLCAGKNVKIWTKRAQSFTQFWHDMLLKENAIYFDCPSCSFIVIK